MRDDALCPVTGLPGKPTREFSGDQLFHLYETYLQKPLPEELKGKFFQQDVIEYTCADSGVRWYAPATPGDGAYYETLARNYDWYYDPDRWDKTTAENWLKTVRPPTVVEIACGNGEMLKKIREIGLRGVGVELSGKAVEACRRDGLTAYTTTETEELKKIGEVDALLLLQVIEHVPEPAAFLKLQVDQFSPEWIVISAPCYSGLLGITTDPLSWPPHHVTSWSPLGMRSLAKKVGYEVTELRLQPTTAQELHYRAQCELAKHLPGMAGWAEWCLGLRGVRRFGKQIMAAFSALGFKWAKCSHSIFVVLHALKANGA